MQCKSRTLFLALAALAAAVLFGGSAIQAQDNAEPVAVPDEASAEEPLREQSIYIPYDDLREVFEEHGRGVFLPYEQFQQLWEAARRQAAPRAEAQPPVAAVITLSENEATVAEDVVEVKARLSIELLAEGWHEIPLRLSDAAITSATFDGEPARIVGGQGRDYRLLIEKKGKEPEQHTLELQYAKAIQRTPGQNRVSFEAPRAPISRWRVTIPQAGVKVNIEPLLAATEVPAAKPPEAAEAAAEPAPADQTVVLAFVGAAPVVGIQWTPKAEGAAGLEAIASVQAEQQVWITEGATQTRARLAYTISRAELSALTIQVPADQKVANVFDANVRQWTVEEPAADAETKQITVQLFEPARGSQQVTVELEKFAEDDAGRSVAVPVVKAVGVGRQQGVLVVDVDDGLRAEVGEATGLLRVDDRELPAALRDDDWSFSYRFASALFVLSLQVEKVDPKLVTDSLIEVYLQPERLSLDVLTVSTIRQGGVFRLDLEVPAGFEVVDVRGQETAGAEAAVVDSYHLEEPEDEQADSRRLVVNLARKAEKAVALFVQLRRELDEPGLRLPDADPAAIAAAIPMPAGPIQRGAGRLVIYAPESLRVTPSQSDALRAVSFSEALDGMPSSRGQHAGELRQVLAFAYAQTPGRLEFSAARRRPEVTMRQFLVARIESGLIKYEATFHYQVRYSGVEMLEIDVPEAVAAELRNQSSLRDTRVQPGADDSPLPKGYVRWGFAGESELLGEGDIKLTWDEPIEGLDVDKSRDLDVPRLIPVGVDRAWGQIVLTKAETLDIATKKKSDSLQGIDPQHDLVVEVSEAARALEFHDDWELTITATHYRLEPIKHTSIELGVVRMVVTRSGRIAVQGLYRVRSAQQQLQVKLPDGASLDTSPVRINGQRTPLQTLGGDYFVPLVDSDDDRPFLLELRYTVDGGGRLDLPDFPQEPAVLKLYLAAYLPEEWALLGSQGPWTQQFEWRSDANNPLRPIPVVWDGADQWDRTVVNAERLIEELISGVPDLSGNPFDSFKTDGVEYLFSTLKPDPPPGGSLRLRSIDDRLLSAIVFVVVLLGGLVLLPAGLGVRVMAIGSLIVILVLGGVFLPTLTVQILDGTLAAAIFIVVVLWIAWFFWRTLPRLWRRSRLMKAEAGETSPRAVPPPESFTRPSEQGPELKDEISQPDKPLPPPRKARPKDEPPTDEPPADGDKGGPSNA